nr:MAG TPA: Cytosine specific methyltransferase [Caudoviricetes sp.]
MVENKDKKYNSDKQWELVNFCEFDKYATKSYCAIHNVDESLNLGDITKVDETDLDDFNMMTWGFPCTDISVAGKQKGFIDEDGEKTRSGMYYEGIRILREKKPALSIIENVKNLTGKRFKNEFEMVLSDLDDAGYNTYYQVLNAKNYGVPQNRERVFIISIRKDLDNGKFKFPEPFDNGLRLKDLLEDEVDEKFYISDEKVERFITNAKENKYCNKKANFTPELWKSCYAIRSQEFVRTGFTDDCSTLTARDYKDPRCVVVHKNEETNIVKQVGNISDCKGNWDNPQVGRVYDTSGCSPTLNTCSGGGDEPKVITGLVKNQGEQFAKETDCANTLLARDYKGFGNQEMNYVTENNVKEIGYIKKTEDGKKHQSNTVYDSDHIGRSLCACDYKSPMMVNIKQATKQGYIECEVGGVADLSYPDSKTRRGRVQDNGNISPTITATETGICRIESPIRIRKLTPKECFRLMGFSDENFDAAQKVGISNSQLYKQAGNSIVVDVLYYIYVELYKAMPYLFDDLKLSSFFSGIGAFEIALDKLYKDINSGNFINPQTE